MCKPILMAFTITMCFFINVGQTSAAQHHEDHAIKKISTLHLSHDVKIILNQEMRKIEDGMMKIIPAIAGGDWQTITHIAKRIKKSFILKQKLTPKQMEELHQSLPAEFIEMDQYFHTTAGKLAHAALERDAELVNFYFYKLHNQCTKCHSKYASERFPNLKAID